MTNTCNFWKRIGMLHQQIKKKHNIVPLYFTSKIKSLFSNS